MVNLVSGFNFNAHIIWYLNQNRILKKCDYEIPVLIYNNVFDFKKLKSYDILKLEKTKNSLKSDKNSREDEENIFPDVGEISWDDILNKN